MSLRTFFLSAVAILSLAACDMRDPERIPETQNPTVLRVYTVPAERAELMRDALNRVLGKKGKASLAAADKILVLAPAILQSSVSETITVLVKDVPPPVAEAGPVRLQVWVVDVAETEVADPRLLALQPTLVAIKQSLGATAFSLRSHLTVQSRISDNPMGAATASDTEARFTARLNAVDGGVVADLDVSAGVMNVRTQTRLRFGETVVLAQANPSEDGQARIRLLLVRADPAS